ncbi:MobF family relaxase [Mucilaginibacter pedocola]|uniref:Conjugal transfer protein n=1 Tax=Mucilaginibacter pedocola TaxID=1792845 RepID=A0A1S9P8T1_9SPHI|nr:MobF family relaxase [Mucilaginibacter pedocola]OOQ57380.1 conjugal transfer protein [Mucilaginibacter pedocola]
MIRMIQSTSAGQAKAYFAEALLKADYYINDQELQGRFEGKLSDRLGIAGVAEKQAFFDLCENIHPVTSKPLTPRTKEERTVGYDINFHAPKSVSIVHALSKDEHILKAFEKSVRETMGEIESDSMTRVRKKKTYEDRKTGELIYASFTHQTARPVEGFVPDPHLHSHCFVFNATWDKDEQRIKAAQFREINRDMPYYQARFQKRLADELIDLGYDVRRTNKAFEIVGVPQIAINLFSKRTDEIGRVAKERGISDPKALGELGAKTRASKQKGMSMDELQASWRMQLREHENGEGNTTDPIIRHNPEKIKKQLYGPQDCIDHALKHHFERASVAPERRLLEAACKHSIGERQVSLKDVELAFEKDQRIIHVKENNRNVCTMTGVLAEERDMVQLARKGQNKFRPLYDKTPPINLKGPQGAAIEYLLTSPHQVSLVRGVAGAGKTTMMRELTDHIKNTGKEVSVLAPTAEASRGVLAAEGFDDATTVAGFLKDKQRQENLYNNVLIVDEAGLLGTTDTLSLLKVADSQNARIIFVGDTRQHTSVVRGDAMRILNTVANIKAAEVNQIRRQQDKAYREAVEDLSKGNVADAFDKLAEMNAIKTIDPLKPNEQIADDYVAAIRQKKTALIVSPTHKEKDNVTTEVRQRLLDANLLGKKELIVTKLNNANFTEAEKGDWRNYKDSDKIKFNQNVPKISRGSLWSISSVNDGQVSLLNETGETHQLPLERAKAFDVFIEQPISLRKGDKVRITRNGFDLENKRMNNGQSLEVKNVSKSGKISLAGADGKSSYTLNENFGHLDHAYCTTSHSSQGKTVDKVFIAQPSSTFTATDAKQFYVSVSRGKESVSIYTDDCDELLLNASRLGERQSAMELVDNTKNRHTEHIFNNQRNAVRETNRTDLAQENERPTRNIDRNYEP